MGMGAELLMDMVVDAEIDAMILQEQYEEDCRLCDQGLWRMRNGHTIPIKAMSTSHLTNTIAMINRNLLRYEEHYLDLALVARAKMETELKKRYPPVDPAEGFFDEE